MRQIERASVVRIVSDLIKADGIIDIREIDFFDALKEKYGIIEEDEIFAESCTLSQSLSVIANFDEKDRHSLMNDFWKTTMSDDFCTKEEALLLLALRLNLTVKIPNEVTVLSVESSTFIIRKSKFPQNPKRSVRFSGKGTKRSVQKRKARNTQKAETKVL